MVSRQRVSKTQNRVVSVHLLVFVDSFFSTIVIVVVILQYITIVSSQAHKIRAKKRKMKINKGGNFKQPPSNLNNYVTTMRYIIAREFLYKGKKEFFSRSENKRRETQCEFQQFIKSRRFQEPIGVDSTILCFKIAGGYVKGKRLSICDLIKTIKREGGRVANRKSTVNRNYPPFQDATGKGKPQNRFGDQFGVEKVEDE